MFNISIKTKSNHQSKQMFPNYISCFFFLYKISFHSWFIKTLWFNIYCKNSIDATFFKTNKYIMRVALLSGRNRLISTIYVDDNLSKFTHILFPTTTFQQLLSSKTRSVYVELRRQNSLAAADDILCSRRRYSVKEERENVRLPPRSARPVR